MAKWNPIAAGTRFSRLLVLSDDGPRKVLCRCDCGVERLRNRCKLMGGTIKSCGCAYGDRGRPLAAGERFGRLVVVADEGPRAVHVQCDCGRTNIVRRFSLRVKGTKSCGCSQTDDIARESCRARFTTHGRSTSGLYRIWADMRKRCSNPRTKAFERYGGRGITVCARWQTFDLFAADMGLRPSKGHSLDRIDNARGYEPGNVRWATGAEQSRNTRRNHIIEHDGIRLPLVDWAARAGLKYGTLQDRLRSGWTVERALTEPVAQRHE